MTVQQLALFYLAPAGAAVIYIQFIAKMIPQEGNILATPFKPIFSPTTGNFINRQ